jgi:hypothetical protein
MLSSQSKYHSKLKFTPDLIALSPNQCSVPKNNAHFTAFLAHQPHSLTFEQAFHFRFEGANFFRGRFIRSPTLRPDFGHLRLPGDQNFLLLPCPSIPNFCKFQFQQRYYPRSDMNRSSSIYLPFVLPIKNY